MQIHSKCNMRVWYWPSKARTLIFRIGEGLKSYYLKENVGFFTRLYDVLYSSPVAGHLQLSYKRKTDVLKRYYEDCKHAEEVCILDTCYWVVVHHATIHYNYHTLQLWTLHNTSIFYDPTPRATSFPGSGKEVDPRAENIADRGTFHGRWNFLRMAEKGIACSQTLLFLRQATKN
jgi:hypothetical protein